ncbi:nickel/cobalt transporter [Tabrizicola sp.]|uniref:nickel/cobalt transporter n=1 Tax=Tabrizicola sp. TaxID=2005166 RepID=UPI0035AF7E77
MRRGLGLAGLALVLVLVLLWLGGALDAPALWLEAAQRATQERLAGAIRALRGGEPGALAAFWGACLAYGVLHAAGPGHGKLVIGGYGVARRVPVGRLAGLALISSLAQAAVAVALVYSLVAALGLARGAVEGAAEDWLTPMGHAMIAGLGLWLVLRGVRGLGHDHGHDHGHAHDHRHGPGCGHAHGPSVAEVERVAGWRDAALLVAGIAVRPCSGALFVLVLTWQLGIALAGVVGAFVMGLGTALVTVAVALMAVWAREGALAGLGGGRIARMIPLLELTLGTAIALAALMLLWRGA